MKRLVLIDGYSLLHRAYFALPKTIAKSDGQIINAVYGFTRTLLKVIEDLKPDYIALFFDTKGPTFRDQMYPAYKADRPVMEKELEGQLKEVEKVAEALNLKIFARSGFEADDLIATVTHQMQNKDIETVVFSGDQDLLQLVSEKVKVYYPKKGLSEPVLYDFKGVQDNFGIIPEKIVDYKALRGDPSDNIPGVKGIGEKTAIDLLKQFRDLDDIYKNLDKVDIRVAELLKHGKDSAYLSRELAEVKRDVSVNFELEKMELALDKEKLLKMFEQLEFKSLIKQLTKDDRSEEDGQLNLI